MTPGLLHTYLPACTLVSTCSQVISQKEGDYFFDLAARVRLGKEEQAPEGR